MIRGTTPKHTFVLPFNTDTIAKARVVYSQTGRPVLIKEHEDLVLEGNTVEVHLTQQETLDFFCGKDVLVQVRVLTQTGEAMASDIQRVDVGRCLDDEVLV